MKNRVLLIGGHSDNDRITLHSFNNTVTAIKLKTGEIKYETENTKFISLSNFFYTIIGYAILYLPHHYKANHIIKEIETGNKPTYFYLALALFYLLITIISLIYMQITQNILMNHSAEHMIIHAYHRLKRIPTIEEAKHFSRFSFFCGSNVAPALIVAQLIGYIVYIHTGFIIPEILLFIVPHIIPGIFLVGLIAQLFTTKKPHDENIELAIAAISELERISN